MKNEVEYVRYGKIHSGERQGSATAVQLPSLPCSSVAITALASNSGSVFLGGAGVTVPDGTTDTTSGLELEAGDMTQFIPVSNLNLLYIICDNAGDDVTYQVLGGGLRSYKERVLDVQSANLILYHQMNELSGSIAKDHSAEGNNGAYTGVTLGQDGIGDGNTCPYFDGTNDYNNIYSSALNTDFNGDAGTIAIWVRAASGIWDDGTAHWFLRMRSDNDNTFFMRKDSTNNQLTWRRVAGGTSKNISKSSVSETDWFHMALTWDASAGGDGEVKSYYNGTQNGSTLTAIDNWADPGNLASGNTAVGSAGGTALPWKGWLAHAAIWKVALSAAEIADLATV